MAANMEVQRRRQTAILLFSLKIMFMLFSAFPIFEKVYSGAIITEFVRDSQVIAGVFTMMATAVILMLFTFFTFGEKRTKKYFQFLELPIFFIVYIMALYFSGLHESHYKFLFIFIIIYYTIQYSSSVGNIIAGFAAAVVLGIDLIFGNTSPVNVNFQQDIALVASFMAVSQTLGTYVKIERDHIEYLKHYANIDGLTGIFNHRYLHESLEHIFTMCKEEGRTLSLIMFDIDYFKKYNDMYGHQKGDNVLRMLSNLVGQDLKTDYVFGRYGGEEFVIILPDTDLDDALKLAYKIRNDVYEYEFPGQDALPRESLTVSLGVSTIELDDTEYDSLIRRADSALYRAKYLRRNSIEIYASAIDKFNKENPTDFNFNEFIGPLKTLISIINSRDSYTYNHVERVVYYSEVFSDYVGLNKEEKHQLIYAAYLHDLGKINIPKDILIKSTPLSDEEWNCIKEHSLSGYRMLENIESYKELAVIVLQHHEKYDGTGYPNGTAGVDLHPLARMLTLADSFDAMTTERPYNRRLSFEEAFLELRRCAGSQFDPKLTEPFIAAIRAIQAEDINTAVVNVDSRPLSS